MHPDRLFPAEPEIRRLARSLYEAVADLPIVSPHGHTDPAWFADNAPFGNPAELLITPDHYVYRMLYSQGVTLPELGIAPEAGDKSAVETDPEVVWRRFAEHYHLFRGTPTRIWLDHVFEEVFGLDEPFGPATADAFYRHIQTALQTPD
ncbi:MAG: glucuronate isomerase, partial [Gammaproteobacteria bacterium]|nr:glucuronate isomerase [Gammaproteobacteria bacterium]